mmetsp:Transcript_26831/g.65098  ORF Transcript_26831/g.65098 Transcript_26831/m.65098 type:complete len:342 (+) Transcript_26831:1250-2275(+)
MDPPLNLQLLGRLTRKEHGDSRSVFSRQILADFTTRTSGSFLSGERFWSPRANSFRISSPKASNALLSSPVGPGGPHSSFSSVACAEEEDDGGGGGGAKGLHTSRTSTFGWPAYLLWKVLNAAVATAAAASGGYCIVPTDIAASARRQPALSPSSLRFLAREPNGTTRSPPPAVSPPPDALLGSSLRSSRVDCRVDSAERLGPWPVEALPPPPLLSVPGARCPAGLEYPLRCVAGLAHFSTLAASIWMCCPTYLFLPPPPPPPPTCIAPSLFWESASRCSRPSQCACSETSSRARGRASNAPMTSPQHSSKPGTRSQNASWRLGTIRTPIGTMSRPRPARR